MRTLHGDGNGKVLDIGITVAETSRCEYEDEHGRCKNDKHYGDLFCVWHRSLVIALTELQRLENRLDD